MNQPKLSTVAPLLNGIVIMSIWLNAFLAYALFVQAPNRDLIIAGSYVMSYIWAVVFLALSVAMFVIKYLNHWLWIRTTLICGLFVKSIFTYALIVLGFQFGFKHTIGVTALWIAITWTQFYAVKTFKLPGSKYDQ